MSSKPLLEHPSNSRSWTLPGKPLWRSVHSRGGRLSDLVQGVSIEEKGKGKPHWRTGYYADEGYWNEEPSYEHDPYHYDFLSR